MSAEPDTPNRKYMHPDSPEARAKAAERLAHEKGIERAEWLNLWRIYERCVEISEMVWSDRLDESQLVQDSLSQGMRDRGPEGAAGTLAIPVPLFTPRDRLQFIKETAATLLISADRRQLSVRFPKEGISAPPKPQEAPEPGLQAASGAAEGEVDEKAPEGTHDLLAGTGQDRPNMEVAS